MGGGTLLIPMLTIIMGVEQPIAQSTNLLVFVPCAIIVTIIYAFQKQIDFNLSWKVALPAVAVSIFSALLAVKIDSKILKTIFGIFIATLGLVQIIVYIVKKVKEKKSANKTN